MKGNVSPARNSSKLRMLMYFRAFAKLRKATKLNYVFICPSTWNISASTVWISMKYYIWLFFKNLCRKFECHYNMTRIRGTLHEDLCTFIILSRWILLRMRTSSGKTCKENQIAHFTFTNVFPKIVPFMR